MTISDIDRLIQLLAKLPGLGPRSARRAALHLLKRRESLMQPLARALDDAAANIRTCSTCGNLDTADPCAVCSANHSPAVQIASAAAPPAQPLHGKRLAAAPSQAPRRITSPTPSSRAPPTA